MLCLLPVDEELQLGLDVHPGQAAGQLDPLVERQLGRQPADLRRHGRRLWNVVSDFQTYPYTSVQ